MAEADITRTRAEGPQEVLLRGDPEGRRCERRTVRLKETVAVAVFAGDGGGGAEVEPLPLEINMVKYGGRSPKFIWDSMSRDVHNCTH